MGVNVNAVFPHDVEAHHVGMVLDRLLGGNFDNPFEASEANPSVPQCTNVVISHQAQKNLDRLRGDRGFHLLFHNNMRSRDQSWVGVGIMPPSNPFWVAACRRLVAFFGGELVVNDCADDVQPEAYKRSCPVDKHNLLPDDDPAWEKFWDAVDNIPMLTRDEIVAEVPNAAYKMDIPYTSPEDEVECPTCKTRWVP